MKPTRYYEREQFIIDRCRGRRALHIGCVGFADHTDEERVQRAPEALHYKLTAVTSSIVGVDYSAAVVETYRRLGIYDNIIVGDATRLGECGLKPDFDVIVAGDILEHLGEPGRLLAGVSDLCNPETEVLISVPNAFGFANFMRYAMGKFRDGAEHVMMFNHQNLDQLMARYGLRMVESYSAYEEKSKAVTPGYLFKPAHAVFSKWPHLGGTLIAVAKAV
jgi:2-polyprenyl-3-methyl-5-hydroxy-6-metoxy-1,4-benzoquinol methylase